MLAPAPFARRFAVPMLGLLAVSLASTRALSTSQAKVSGPRKVVIFASAEIHGALEPCGCTSDPLGDVSRLATLLRQSRAEVPTLYVDAGSSLYPDGTLAPRQKPAADARAETLGRILGRLGAAGLGAGDTDMAHEGTSAVWPGGKRLASNLPGAPFVEPAKIVDAGDIRVGLVGIVDPEVARAASLKPEDPTAAAKRDAALLRQKGAEIVLLLAPVDRTLARKLARETGVDFVVLGRQVGKGNPRAEKIGDAFLLTPEDELQRVVRLEVVLRAARDGGRVVLSNAGGPEERELRKAELSRDLARLEAQLADWEKKGARGEFVDSKKNERAGLTTEKAALDQPWQPPASGDYFTSALIPLRRRIPQDAGVRAEMKRLDRTVATLNLKNAVPPPKAEPGRAFFVGDAKCASCHKSAVAFWKKTVHAQAWKTLVDVGKQADDKCVGCHVTGFGQVGGSSLGFTRHFENVQCESCHGPGSNHVAGEGNEAPLAIRRDTPESTCTTCHTEQHSDTFNYEAYLRDIVGPGHGPARREKLGAGATGHELRSAALAAAAVAARRDSANGVGVTSRAVPARQAD